MVLLTFISIVFHNFPFVISRSIRILQIQMKCPEYLLCSPSKSSNRLSSPFSRIGFNGVCPNYENCNYKHYHPKNLIPTLEQFELDPNDYIAKMLNCVGSKDLLIYFDGLVHLIVNTPQVRDSINFRDLFKKVTLYKVWVVNHNHFLERLQQHYFIMLPRSSHHQGLSDWAASEGRGPICPAYSVLGPFHSL